ncbi:G-rich sequence factor 1 [Pagrus major]|uniref:G-rich sequence factor 1 n=1 Tax=Pagrus major TaxID=143350 RepID=UPI003CC88D9B
MSGNSKSLLFLLRRCVAVRQLTLPTGIRTRGGVLSARCGFIQQRTWTSSTRTVCLQRLCQLQSALKTSQYSFCTKTGGPYEDDYPPLLAYQSDSEEEKKEVYIVQVKGFPWSCSAEDLLHFFSECSIRDGVKGIHFTVNKSGRPSGQAFIEMENEIDVSKALEKHRQYLGPRYVEVYEVTNSDAEDILKKSIQTPSLGGVVRLRGLPFSSTKADIVQFFSGLDIVEKGVTIIPDHLGRNSGDAYVQFSSQEAADDALLRNKENIGNRYIEVFPSSVDQIHSRIMTRNSSQSANRRTDSQAGPKTRSPQSSAQPLHYVHVRGLPYQVSGQDIVKLFSPIIVSKIVIECAPDGRLSGEADVYFSCHQDAATAMSRDRQHIGGRYVELFLNSVPDYD